MDRKMADSTFRSVLAPAIGGIIIAAVTYYFFTTKPTEPAEGIYIEYRTQTVGAVVFKNMLVKLNPIPAEQLQASADRFRDYFGYYDDVTLASYTVENKSSRAISNLIFNIDRSETALTPKLSSLFVKDNSGLRQITAGDKSASIAVLPGDRATLEMIIQGRPYQQPGKFTVENEAVPVKEIEPAFNDAFSDLVNGNPAMIFLLAASGAIFWFSLLLLIGLQYLYRSRPNIWATSVSSLTLGQMLALLNYLKIENPPKYSTAVAEAEALYRKWYPSRIMTSKESNEDLA